MQVLDPDFLFTDCPDEARRTIIWQNVGSEGMINSGIKRLIVVVKGEPYSIPIF